jgi:hypothetical protein
VNIAFHALLGVLIAKLMGMTTLTYILVGILLSVLPDFDHIPYLPKAFKTGRFGVESRSPLHESIGILIVILISIIVSLGYSYPFLLAIFCGLSHFAVDFLTRPFRPLYPFSNKTVDLHIYPRNLRKMFVADAVSTAILCMFLAIVTLSG